MNTQTNLSAQNSKNSKLAMSSKKFTRSVTISSKKSNSKVQNEQTEEEL